MRLVGWRSDDVDELLQCSLTGLFSDLVDFLEIGVGMLAFKLASRFLRVELLHHLGEFLG